MGERVKLSKESLDRIFRKRKFSIYFNIPVEIICNILDINYDQFKELIDLSDYNISELHFEYCEDLRGTNISGLDLNDPRYAHFAEPCDVVNYDFKEDDKKLTNLPFITNEEIEILRTEINNRNIVAVPSDNGTSDGVKIRRRA